MPSPTSRVVIFDSGVGGLSVFAEVRRQIPGCELIFVSDTAGFPYGIRSEVDLIERVEKVLGRLISELQPDIMVIACNSASTVVLPVIRSQFDTPFVGVVPAIKPAAAQSQSHSIGLLATPATVSRPYTKQLILDFAHNCKVVPLGSSELVYLAEAKLRGKPVSIEQVASIIAPLFDDSHHPGLDTIVLACTHFPLLLEELKLAAPRPVHWVDSSDAIARRVQSILGPGATGASSDHLQRAIFTGQATVEPSLVQALAARGIVNIVNMDI